MRVYGESLSFVHADDVCTTDSSTPGKISQVGGHHHRNLLPETQNLQRKLKSNTLQVGCRPQYRPGLWDYYLLAKTWLHN